MSDRLSEIIAESFCYGNLSICGLDIKAPTKESYKLLIDKLRESDPSRGVETFWCLVRNVKQIEMVSIDYIDFIKDIFDILDDRFGSKMTIDFNTPFAIKLFIISEMFHTIAAVNLERNIQGVYKHFTYTFKHIIKFIDDNELTTFYHVPGNGTSTWQPEWKIEWVDSNNSCLEVIKDTSIDIFTENVLNSPKIHGYADSSFASLGNMVEVIAIRLTWLKRVAPQYFRFLDGIGLLTEFSHWVFHNFPYNEISNGYLQLIPLSDDIYLPPGADRELDMIDLIFEMIPENVATYLLGFSHITGAISKRKIRQYVQQSKAAGYFDQIKCRNWKYVESTMFHDKKIGNLDEDGEQLNVLYFPIDSYNIADISVLYCNDFYYLFTYPEFQNISHSTTNPYNRKQIDTGYLNLLRDNIVIKNLMKDDLAERGLVVDMNATMQENYDELLEKVHIYTRPIPKRRYIPEEMISLIFPNLS